MAEQQRINITMNPIPTAWNYVIRPAYREESGVLTDMILAMAVESEGLSLDYGTLEKGVRRVFETPHLGTYWVIEAVHPEAPADTSVEPAQLVGCNMITVEWSDWYNAPYWWLQSVYIHPEHRGRGLFDRLMQTLENAARAEGVREFRLYVDANNGAAIRAYEKTGFDHGHYKVMDRKI